MTYRLTVEYGSSPTELGKYPSEEGGLSAVQVEQSVGAFLRDMLHLDGSAVQRVTIAREDE